MSTATSPDDTTPVGTTGSEAGKEGLRGNLGTFHLLFTVLAFNAPLAVMVGFVPVVIGFGNGVGAPAAYLVCGGILALFAVGFTAMTRHVPMPGGFYAYITAGLGRTIGLGSSFLALLCYFFVLIGSYCYGGLALESLVHDTLKGPHVAWWVWVLVLQAITGTLGYLKLDLSARVLSYLLVGEIIVVLVYDACVVFKGGANGLNVVDSFSTHHMFSGSIGLALLFGITCFGGFEATAIFREEVRDPARTIPRATYLVILLVTAMYAVGAWVLIQGYGADQAVAATGADPTGSVMSSIGTYAGKAALDVTTVLLNTSIFAALLASHNISSRYMYNLSVDGIFPRALSRVHGSQGSPHIASVTLSGLALLALIPMVAADADPATLYARLCGIYGYGLILLLLITCIAVPVFLRRTEARGLTVWQTTIAPALAVIGLVVAGVLATQNFDLLIGGSKTFGYVTLAGVYAVIAAGIVLALVFRKTRPETYARIGRQ